MPRRRLLAEKGPSGARFLYATALQADLRWAIPVRRVALSQGLTYDRSATASPSVKGLVAHPFYRMEKPLPRQARRSEESLFLTIASDATTAINVRTFR